MNYELAKRLKDAGFSQKNSGDCIHSSRNEWDISCDCVTKGESAYIPTLSELISACGENFECLVRTDAGFVANSSHRWAFEEEGSTPEEAVANLWLALNEKS